MPLLSGRIALTVYAFSLFAVQAFTLPNDRPEVSIGDSRSDIPPPMPQIPRAPMPTEPRPADPNLPQKNQRAEVKEVVKLGPKGLPGLIDAVVARRTRGPELGLAPELGVGSEFYPVSKAALTLDKVGEGAVGVVRARWGKLDDVQRWRLMRFRGQFDYDAALMYALASLDSKNVDVQEQAILYAGKYKEARARDKLIELLNNGAPRVRWKVVDALTQIGGDAVVDAFIDLLAPDSWAAKGKGRNWLPFEGTQPTWWPDYRAFIIDALRELKAKKSGPALLGVLREKGPGKGYLALQIAPALAEFEYREALPEFRRILMTAPESLVVPLGRVGPGWLAEEIRSDVAKAIEQLESAEK